MFKRSIVPSMAALAITVSACGNSAGRYQPIVDGPRNATYSMDLASCQDTAGERSYVNGDMRSNALLWGGLGSAVGVIDEGVEGALIGGLIAGAIAAGATAWDTRDERRDIVIDCMRNRGHDVVG